MATWPASLPTDFLKDAVEETPPDNTIRSKMGVGPPKIRKRSTSAVRKFACSQYQTTAQVAVLDTFFVTTLGDGVTEFTGLTHPRTGASVTFMFAEPPIYARQGLGYMVMFKLELLP